MPRLKPLSIDVLEPEHKALIEKLNELLGFECNDWLTMARVPPIMTAALDLCNTVLENAVDVGEHLRWLVCYACSRSYGCQYCVAHTAFTASRFGVPDEKLQAVKEFESSPHFSEAERAALRVAVSAGKCPSDVSDAEFEELSRHFNENQVVQIIALVSMMGFFNRWNDTIGTELERPPRDTGERVLTDSGWTLGKHGAQAPG